MRHYAVQPDITFLPQPLRISFPLHADTPGKAFKAMIHGPKHKPPKSSFRFPASFPNTAQHRAYPALLFAVSFKALAKKQRPREGNAGFPALLKRARRFFAIICC